MSIDYRAEFDIPRNICYLNAAYMTPQPQRVVAAAFTGATQRSRPWQIAPSNFFDEVEVLRSTYAHQVGCSSENIAIVPSAGYGVSCAAANLPIQKGDVILAMRDQFPSNYYAWRRRTLASDAEFHVVRPETGQSWADALLAAALAHMTTAGFTSAYLWTMEANRLSRAFYEDSGLTFCGRTRESERLSETFLEVQYSCVLPQGT